MTSLIHRGSSSVLQSLYYSYDADGQRTKIEREDNTRFLYQGPDMLKLLQERDAGGSLVAHYTMGNGLEAMRRGNASRFYHFDWLGSTFELTDASGVVTDSYLYNAWGEVLKRTGTTSNPHGYVGMERYYDELTARLQHVGERWYASVSARFMSLDPVRDGTNWYSYVNLCPTANADLRGLQNSHSLTASIYPPVCP